MLNKKDVQSAVEHVAKSLNTPACAVGIFQNGENMFVSYGDRDIKNSLKADEDTMFAIGSASKAFVATAIGILVDDGKLEFDKPVRDYIPEFKMYDPYVTENLTVRDILCHRCGLPRHEFTWYTNLGIYKMEDYMRILRYLKPNKPFRSYFQYQNHMFILAGYLIERVSGKKWDEFIKERILDPIGMKDTCFDSKGYCTYENKALPYSTKDGVSEEIAFRDIYDIGSAGSINSTTKDMVKWLELNLSKGKFNGNQIISEKSLLECHTENSIVTDSPWVFDEISARMYAMGWFVEVYKGVRVIHHGGSIDGFISLVSFIPSLNVGFAILTNQDNGRTAPLIQYYLYDLILGSEKIDWLERNRVVMDKVQQDTKAAENKIREEAVKNTKPTHELKDYTGVYTNEAYGEIEIILEEDKLKIKKCGFVMEFEHLVYDKFLLHIVRLDGVIKSEFYYDIKGNISSVGIDFEPSIKEMAVLKKIK